MSRLRERVSLTRRIVRQAINCIEVHAEALRECHTIPVSGEWPDEPIDQRARREYEQMRRILKALRAA